MTEYGKFRKPRVVVKPMYNEVRERRKKLLDEVRKRRADVIKRLEDGK